MAKDKTLARKSWNRYVSFLRQLSDDATADLYKFLLGEHTPQEQLDFAYALVTKYGEGAAELSCQMHEALAEVAGVVIPPAEPAEPATYYETAAAIRGEQLRTDDPNAVSAVAGRLVKSVGVDTMMKNAIRDGCEWAWIPSGDTCSFCLMLASNGWQKASPKALKNGHAQHIHNNCDCAYVVRFSDDMDVEGYNPKALYNQYISAGDSAKERLRALDRQHYAANREAINARKRQEYARRKDKDKLAP